MTSSPLLPALGGAAGDAVAAVTVAGESVSWSQLHDRAHVLGARIVGLGAVAVEATPTLSTVIAVAAGLAAGVPEIGRAHV